MLHRSRRANLNIVDNFGQLEYQIRASGDGAQTVSRQTIGFGKAIELDQRVFPIVLGKEMVWHGLIKRQKIAVSFIEDKPEFAHLT